MTYQISFRVVTLGTQHKFSDEPIKHVLQLVRLVGSVDDVTVVFGIKLGLSTEFTTKKLGRVCGEDQRTRRNQRIDSSCSAHSETAVVLILKNATIFKH